MSESQQAEGIVSLQKKNSKSICEKWDKMGIPWQGGNLTHSSFDISDGKIKSEIVKAVEHDGKGSFGRSIYLPKHRQNYP